MNKINAIKNVIVSILFGFNLVAIYGQNNNSGRLPEITITYPETWNINGIDYKIIKTTLYGKNIFAVHCLVDFKPGDDLMSKAFAADVARYAFVNGYLMNALKYNKVFSPGIEVIDDYIGISLVSEYDETTQTERGFGYVYKISEIFDDIPIQMDIPGLKYYTEDFEIDIRNKLIDIFSNGDYESIYNLYCENALKTMVKKDEAEVLIFYNKIDSIRKNENRESAIIFLGKLGGRNGYLMYLPVFIRSKAYKSIEVEGNMILLLTDEAEVVGVYGFNLNILDEQEFKYF